MDADVKIGSLLLHLLNSLGCSSASYLWPSISIYRKIDKEEFKKVMALMRAHNRQGAKHRDGLRTGFKFHGSVENGGLLEYFFGKDGEERLQHDKFFQFMRDLHDEVSRLHLLHKLWIALKLILLSIVAASLVATRFVKPKINNPNLSNKKG